MRMVEESPSAAELAGVGVALAVVAQWRTANELTGVVAFTCGLRAANAALNGGMLFAQVTFAVGIASAPPSKVVIAPVHAASGFWVRAASMASAAS